MKDTLKPLHIFLPAVLTGLAGFGLRAAFYRVGFDQRGLPVRMHPLQLGCMLLVLAAAALCLLALKKADLGCRPARFLHPLGRGLLAPVVCGGLLYHGWQLFCLIRPALAIPDLLDILPLARVILALAAGAAALILLWAPPRNGLVNLACCSAFTLFFTLEMLCRYQLWSGNPRIQDYVLPVFACICFALCSYYRMAFFGEIHSPRAHGFTSVMGLVLGLICAAGPDTPAFYLAGAAWCAVGILGNPAAGAGGPDPNEEETE